MSSRFEPIRSGIHRPIHAAPAYVLAVVDSGISPHPDLNDALGNTRVITHVNFVLNSPIPDDFYGHGTHLAGTIAGAGQSSGGVYMGIAPEAELLDIKVMDDRGRGHMPMCWPGYSGSITTVKPIELVLLTSL